MEHDLGKELGGTKVHEIGKQVCLALACVCMHMCLFTLGIRFYCCPNGPVHIDCPLQQAAQEMFQNADADDDDYLEFEDYDDYGDHDYRMRNQRPQAIKEGPATHVRRSLVSIFANFCTAS